MFSILSTNLAKLRVWGFVGVCSYVRERLLYWRTALVIALAILVVYLLLLVRFESWHRAFLAPLPTVASVFGAGAIIVHRRSVHGLTTAAGIWVSAGIGMAVASGLYAVSVAASVLSIVGLEVLGWVFRRHRKADEGGCAGEKTA